MTVSRLIARPMLASTFMIGGARTLKNPSGPATKVGPITSRLAPLVEKAGVPVPDDPETLVRINAGVHVAAGLALATGRAPRLAAAILAASLVPTTIAGHAFWESTDPVERRQHLVHFFKNVSILGGLIIAAGDTEGRPGVAWRARHAAKDARREAKLLKAKVRS
jgi:putative oxidoreductase